ncbi:MAG: hypothetical protein HYX78_05765 [Armatimonadetes bacterium]|nr:hypothetical protein [Armatimonadota bacterium]
MNQVVYTKCIVAFLDICGFRTHIEQSETDPSKAENILSVMKKAQRLAKQVKHLNTVYTDSGDRMTVFSDSIILSQPIQVQDSGTLLLFLLRVAGIQLELLAHSYILRGGIAYGDTYHDEGIAFGPALIEAYDLERIADKPRVIIKNTVVTETFKLPLTKYSNS